MSLEENSKPLIPHICNAYISLCLDMINATKLVNAMIANFYTDGDCRQILIQVIQYTHRNFVSGCMGSILCLSLC